MNFDGPETPHTNLNTHAIAGALRCSEFPVVLSEDAGAYICNETFYTLMNVPPDHYLFNLRRGFIHVPPLNAEVGRSNNVSVHFD